MAHVRPRHPRARSLARERSFVKAAKISGASNWRIISRHIAPNVLPMAFLYGVFAIAWAILTEAGVSFLGLGDPGSVSWGMMLQERRVYSAMTEGTGGGSCRPESVSPSWSSAASSSAAATKR